MSEQIEAPVVNETTLAPEAPQGETIADAPGGTDNDAALEGVVEQEDGKTNDGIIDAEKQRSEKRLSGIQKRLNELTRDKYSERQAREALERQNSELMALLKGGTKTAPPEDAAPRQDQYTDYAEFVKADAIYHAVKAADAKIAAADKKAAETVQFQAYAQDEQAATTAYAQRAAAAAKSLPDFEEVMQDAADMRVPPNVLSMIKRLENGPTIAYHMAKNPALAQQFYSQPVAMHGVLLGQLSATLKGAPQVSTAPAPGQTVKSQASASSEPPEDTEKYMAWAKKI